jgi:transcriptional regulator with XRE-family HTH domain
MRNIGRRVLELRRARGWTQEQAAERMRLDAVALRRIEAGRQLVTLRTLVRLANALGVPTRALFDEAQIREARRPGRPPAERSAAEKRPRRPTRG